MIRDQRAIAYAQFVDNRTIMDQIEKSNKEFIKDQDYIRARSLFNSARFILLMFGGKEVVQSLADFSYSIGDDYRIATTRLFQAMRHDLLSESDYVDDTTIDKVLGGPSK